MLFKLKKLPKKNLSLITIINFIFAKNAKSEVTVAKNGQGAKKKHQAVFILATSSRPSSSIDISLILNF